MAHKTLIGGTAYEIGGGKTLINGTGYSIDKGKTLVGGTGYEVAFASFVPILDLGELTLAFASGVGAYQIIDSSHKTIPDNMEEVNAISINGEIIPLPYQWSLNNGLSGRSNSEQTNDAGSHIVQKAGDIVATWAYLSFGNNYWITVQSFSDIGTCVFVLGKI